jgi:hypothetical protein
VIPIERIGRLTSDSSVFTFSIMRVLGALNLAALVLRAVFKRSRLHWNLALTLYSAYLFVGILTLRYTSDFAFGVRAAGAAAGNVLFLFVVINLVNDRRHIRLALAAWLITTSLAGAFTLYQWYTGARHITENRFNSTGQRETDDRFETVMEDAAEYDESVAMPRALGPTSHPAVYAINNILSVPFFVFFVRFGRRWWARGAAGAGALLACYNVLLTNTRAALLTMALAAGLILLTGLVRPSWKTWAALLAATTACLPLIPGPVWERVLKLENYQSSRSATFSARMRYWQTGLQVVSENPIWGIGLGHQTEVPRRMRRYMLMPDNSTVHNEYIQDLMEVGLVGYTLLMAFLVVLYRRLRATEKFYRAKKDVATGAILTATRIAFLSVLIYGVQVDVLHFPLKGWWLAMGLAISLFDISRREAASSSYAAPGI